MAENTTAPDDGYVRGDSPSGATRGTTQDRCFVEDVRDAIILSAVARAWRRRRPSPAAPGGPGGW